MKILLLSVIFGLAGSAAPLIVSSYDMLNGNGEASGGSFNYWDAKYNGAGATTTDNAALTGGVGDLTDGIIANQNWNVVENLAGNGPYVGWRQSFVSPLITFRFGGPIELFSITLHLDDSNGTGGVSPPASVDFGLSGGPLTNYLVADPAGSNPFALTIPVALTGQAFDLRLNYRSEWIFLSEVEFDGGPHGDPIPEPSTFALGLAGTTALALLRRRR